jgi:hypothetical protein
MWRPGQVREGELGMVAAGPVSIISTGVAVVPRGNASRLDGAITVGVSVL